MNITKTTVTTVVTTHSLKVELYRAAAPIMAKRDGLEVALVAAPEVEVPALMRDWRDCEKSLRWIDQELAALGCR